MVKILKNCEMFDGPTFENKLKLNQGYGAQKYLQQHKCNASKIYAKTFIIIVKVNENKLINNMVIVTFRLWRNN